MMNVKTTRHKPSTTFKKALRDVHTIEQTRIKSKQPQKKNIFQNTSGFVCQMVQECFKEHVKCKGQTQVLLEFL